MKPTAHLLSAVFFRQEQASINDGLVNPNIRSWFLFPAINPVVINPALSQAVPPLFYLSIYSIYLQIQFMAEGETVRREIEG